MIMTGRNKEEGQKEEGREDKRKRRREEGTKSGQFESTNTNKDNCSDVFNSTP